MASARITVEDIRFYMRDFVARNDLLERLEFKNEEVERAIALIVDRFNSMTPITPNAISINGIPAALKHIIIVGAVSVLLNAEAIAQARNQMSYSDGGIQVSVDDKTSIYKSLAESERAKFEQYADDIKKQMNAEAAFGGSISPYSILPIW